MGMSIDEIRSTLFTAKLRWLLGQALQRGERVLWQGQPDGIARMMFWRFLWWIGIPWLALVAIAVTRGWIAGPGIDLLRENPRFARKLGGSRRRVHVWVVNSAEDLDLCQELGVEAVISDSPGFALRHLTGSTPGSTPERTLGAGAADAGE